LCHATHNPHLKLFYVILIIQGIEFFTKACLYSNFFLYKAVFYNYYQKLTINSNLKMKTNCMPMTSSHTCKVYTTDYVDQLHKGLCIFSSLDFVLKINSETQRVILRIICKFYISWQILHFLVNFTFLVNLTSL